MSATLKLVQLNIEGSKHIERILPFLKIQKPDVVCLQELNDPDIAAFEEALGMKCFYTPMNREKGGFMHGVGIFARDMANMRSARYAGYQREDIPDADYTDREISYHTKCFVLAMVDIGKEGGIFHIGTTHLPATHHAEVTSYQQEAIGGLLKQLQQEKEFVLTGDFNAPRGGEMFAQLADRYTDNIPQEITTSIDGNLHRAGQLPHMVDGIFSTPGYRVSNVSGHTSLSDHWGFTADINKVEI